MTQLATKYIEIHTSKIPQNRSPIISLIILYTRIYSM